MSEATIHDPARSVFTETPYHVAGELSNRGESPGDRLDGTGSTTDRSWICGDHRLWPYSAGSLWARPEERHVPLLFPTTDQRRSVQSGRRAGYDGACGFFESGHRR